MLTNLVPKELDRIYCTPDQYLLKLKVLFRCGYSYVIVIFRTEKQSNHDVDIGKNKLKSSKQGAHQSLGSIAGVA
uniref:Uncharacterized protein n=1 Tax=Lepeophtheirus salmonis TaxID=72036 RepID=A0A0K2V4Z4_LEPSM